MRMLAWCGTNQSMSSADVPVAAKAGRNHRRRAEGSTPEREKPAVAFGRGRLIVDASVDKLLASAADGSVDVRTPDATEVMTALANAGGTVVSTGRGAFTVTGLGPERIATLVADRGLRLFELTPRRATLEDVYLELTRTVTDYAQGGTP